uniref:Uncharacterized protein n=1 Tax=Glossina palpalis gambiensis TaxID=67801 RepID=A0A1B0BY67_9MUSC
MHLSFFILLRPVQWNSPKNTAKPGANWTPQPMAATTGAGYRPMAHGMTVSPAPITINHPYVHASYPVIPNYMQVRLIFNFFVLFRFFFLFLFSFIFFFCFTGFRFNCFFLS